MRAIQIASYGSSLELVDVPDPVPSEGHEVVDVVYAGVNPLDIWVSRGSFAGVTPQPHTPGVEGVARRADGSHVIVSGVGVANAGTYAEKVVTSSSSLVSVPSGVDLEQAAAISVAGITAWMCVQVLAEVRADDVVLVLGASGGVGSLALQIACNAGATVIGQTSSSAKVETINSLGALGVVAREPADLSVALGGQTPTVVVDGLGGGFTGACVEATAPAARIVNFGTSVDPAVSFDMRTFYRKGLRLLGYGGLLLTPHQRAQAYESLFVEIAAGRLRVPIDAVLPLRAAGEAHRRILQREVEGKLLLDPNNDQ